MFNLAQIKSPLKGNAGGLQASGEFSGIQTPIEQTAATPSAVPSFFVPRQSSGFGQGTASDGATAGGMSALGGAPDLEDGSVSGIATMSATGEVTPSRASELGFGDDQPTTSSSAGPVIHNVVATAYLGCELDLRKIAMSTRNAEYNPRRFQAVVMRLRSPAATALVFHSGKVVCTGTKNVEDARTACKMFGRIITKNGYDNVRFSGFKVQNLVATFNVGFSISLDRLSTGKHKQYCNYEPEVFPGLIYKYRTTWKDSEDDSESTRKATCLIFASGKCVIIGARTRKMVMKAYEDIKLLLEDYHMA